MGREGRQTINARLEEAITSPSQSVVLELNWTPTRGEASCWQIDPDPLQIGSPGRAVRGSWGEETDSLEKEGPIRPAGKALSGLRLAI